jgi:hypothetical protein
MRGNLKEFSRFFIPLTRPNVSGLSCPEPCGRSPEGHYGPITVFLVEANPSK